MRTDGNFRRVLFTIPESYSRKALILFFSLLLDFNTSKSKGIVVVNRLNFDFYFPEHVFSPTKLTALFRATYLSMESLKVVGATLYGILAGKSEKRIK